MGIIVCIEPLAGCRFRAREMTDSLVEENGQMSRMSAFNSPLVLGFEHIEQTLNHLSKTNADSYPPYNIERIGEQGLRITLAVAGFKTDDLGVTLEDTRLVIRGRRKPDEARHVYTHRGIAMRQFQRTFVLADCIEVKAAVLDNGLLSIDLQRKSPQGMVRRIAIARGRATKPAPRPVLTIDVADAT